MRWTIVLATLLAALTACADHLAHVRTSASTSLLCHEDDITLRRRRPRVYEAKGCGRTGVLQCRETGHPRCVDLATMARERVANERRCPVEQV